MVRNVRARIIARINVRRWDYSIAVTDGKYLPWLLLARRIERVVRDFQAWPRFGLWQGTCTAGEGRFDRRRHAPAAPPFGEGTNSINQTLQKRHTCEREVPAHAQRLASHFFSLRALTDSVKKLTKRNSSGRPGPAITIFLYLCKIRKQGSGVRRLCQTANHWKKSLDSVRNSLPLWGSC